MKELLDMNRIPKHIAIIMDGNGRWAMDRGLDRTFGHKAGLDNLEQVTTVCSNLGVKYLTVYAFSIENFNRPAYEVEALMGLVHRFSLIVSSLMSPMFISPFCTLRAMILVVFTSSCFDE